MAKPLNIVWTLDVRNGVIHAVIKNAKIWMVLVDVGRTLTAADLSDLMLGRKVVREIDNGEEEPIERETCRLMSTYYGLWRREQHISIHILPPKGLKGGEVTLLSCRLQIETPTTTQNRKYPVSEPEWKALYLWYYSAILDTRLLNNRIAPKRKAGEAI